MSLHELLSEAYRRGASDLHYGAGAAPYIRKNGEMVELAEYGQVPSEEATGEILDFCKLDIPALQERYEWDGIVEGDAFGRVRYHVFNHSEGLAVSMRLISDVPHSLESLGLPEIVGSIAHYKDGLVLVVGMAGAGKSTTLAGLLDAINAVRQEHIVTIEEPIEYVYRSKRSLVRQRAVGEHVLSFSAALRACLREDPDVILIGELRDQETMELALSAAETGHLVLASLHARSAVSAVDRIIDGVSKERQAQARLMLAESLRMVVYQELERSKDGGLVPIVEIMTTPPAVKTLIRDGKTHQLLGLIQSSRREGMQTSSMHRAELEQKGLL